LDENASFDVFIDKIRPAVFAAACNKKEGKVRKGKESQNVIFQLFMGADTKGPIHIKFG